MYDHSTMSYMTSGDFYNTCIVSQLSQNKYYLNQLHCLCSFQINTSIKTQILLIIRIEKFVGSEKYMPNKRKAHEHTRVQNNICIKHLNLST